MIFNLKKCDTYTYCTLNTSIKYEMKMFEASCPVVTKKNLDVRYGYLSFNYFALHLTPNGAIVVWIHNGWRSDNDVGFLNEPEYYSCSHR